MNRLLWPSAVALFVVSVSSDAAAQQQVTAAWVGGPSDGYFSSHWAPHPTPFNEGTFLVNVVIDNMVNQDTTLEFAVEPFALYTLTTRSGDLLRVGGGFEVTGPSILNDGRIKLLEGSKIILHSDTLLSGHGEISGHSVPNNRIYGVPGTVRLTNAIYHVIGGSTSVGSNALRLTNLGSIEASGLANVIIDLEDVGPNYNQGVIRSVLPGLMTIQGTTLDNTGGLIQAGAETPLTISNSTIKGGVIRDEDGPGSGQLILSSTVTLQSTTVDGPVSILNAATLRFLDTVFTNDTWTFNPTAGTSSMVIMPPGATLAGTGTIALGNSPLTQVIGVGGINRLTIGRDITLKGSGKLGNSSLLLTHQGLIEADASAGLVLRFSSDEPNTNTGIIRARNGSAMSMQSTTLDNHGGLIEALAGSSISLAGCTISGGNLTAIESGSDIKTLGTATLDSVTINGSFTTPHNSTTTALNTLTVTGVMALNGQAAPTGQFATLLIDSPEFTLAGAGTTLLTHGTSARIKAGSELPHMILAAEHTLRGSGKIGTGFLELTNRGTIISENGTGLSVSTGAAQFFANEGTVHAANAPISLLTGSFLNTGTVMVDAGTAITRQGGWEQSAGVTRVNGTLSATGPMVISGGSLEGVGSVSAPLVEMVEGTVQPGAGPSNLIGALQIAGDFSQGAAGTLQIELGGTTSGIQSDLLSVTGNVNLGGTLNLSLVDGYLPAQQDQITVVAWTGVRTGDFEVIEGPQNLSITVGPQSITVHVSPRAQVEGDLNGDRTVDGADLGILLASWGLCSKELCPADLNGDDQVDGADLGILLANWS